jgi:hypothetical protein
VAEISSDLIYEILKNLQTRLNNVESVAIEHAHGLNAIRGHLASMQADSSNVYSILTRIDQRLDRIERRLELRELAEPQRPFDHTT